MRYFKQFIIGFVVVILTTFSAAAQTSFTSSDGKINLTLPAGWAVAEDDSTVIIANNLEGLDLGQNRSSATPGTMILLLSATANMPEVGNDPDIAPKELIEMFMSAMDLDGEIVEASVNGFDVVQVAVSNLDTDLSDTEAAVAAIETANGTVFIIMETGDTLADYSDDLLSIAESLTSGASTDTSSAIGSIDYNQTVTGQLSDSVGEQFYTFTGTAGDVVTITMVAEDNNALDSWVWLLTSEGFEGDDLVPLVDNDDAADTSVGAYNAQIVDFTLPETGEYTIRATRIGSGVGNYSLTLESASAATESQTDAPVTMVRQWASNANATTQYGSSSWSAGQATGEPNASETCSDNSSAWASATTGTKESITLIYETAVIPSEINVYQVYNPGSIIEVAVMNSSTGDKVILPNSADPVGNTPCPGVFSIPVSGLAESFDMVTIYLDQSTVASWTEIDAVELVGVDPASVVTTPDTSASTGETASKQFGDGTVMNYPARYSAADSDNTRIELTSPEGSIIRHEAIKSFSGLGEEALSAAVVDAFGGDGLIDPSRLNDVFGDGSVLQYQVGPREYFITYAPFINTTKLLVVRLSESASEEANQAVLVDAQTIAQQMSRPQ